VGGVKAEKVYADLSKYGDRWDGTSVSFSWTAIFSNQLVPELTSNDVGLPKGDLRSWEKLVVVVDELTNCDFFRVLVYNNGDDANHSNTFKVTSTGTNEFTLSGNVDFLNNVTKIVLSGSNWDDSKSGSWSSTTPASFKVSQVYLERPDIVYIEASEVFEAPAGTTNVKDLTGTEKNWANSVTYPKEFAVQGASFGNGDGGKESTHVDIDGYDYICFNVTGATSNSASLRVWIWDDVESKVVTLYAKPIAEYSSADWTTSSRITGTGVYVTKVTGYKYLKGVKAANDWGAPSSTVSMAYMCKGDAPVDYVPTGKYSLVGETPGSATLTDALADESATGYDASGVTGTGLELTPANPNALFTAGAGVLSNAQNVIVNGTCANLVLQDGYPFKAPADFTATTATYTTTIDAEAGAGTLCLPFAAAIPEGVTAYTLAYTSGDKATATAVENTIPANTPVLLNGSGEATFTGAAAAVAATANNAAGTLTGVFEKTKVAQGSYVLQNLDGIGFYKVASDDIYVNPFRAYLTAQASASRIAISFDNVATGIQTVAAQQGDDTVYDLQGRRVSAPTKGLYIVGGKKVMMK
jgi:hypothetical protein